MAADWIRVLPLPDQANAGDDLADIEPDSVRLNAQIPQAGQGSWTVISGEQGRFSDPDDPKSWFFRGENHYDYTLVWSVANPCQTNSDQVSLNFRYTDPFACPGTPTVTDADGNVYPTVLIGNQCWMAKSLKVGRFVQSIQTNSAHSNMGNNGIVEKYCFNNDPANCELYGALYEWYEAMGYSETPGIQGICPDGWHIPDNDDWKELNDHYKYNDAGKYLKVGGGSGFEGHLSGDRHANGGFVSFNSSGFYWSSSSYVYLNYNEGYYRELCACNPFLEEDRFSKLTGASIRCIKNRE